MCFSAIRNLLCLVSVFWTTCFFAHAQTNIPALKKQLAIVKTDSSRSRLLLKLGIEYEQLNSDSCLYFLDQSLQVAQHSRDTFAVVRAMFRMAYTFLYITRDESNALKWLNRGVAIAKKADDNLHLSKCYHLLTAISIHQNTGNALELAHRALNYATKSNDWGVVAESYGFIGDVNMRTQNYKEAEKYFRQSMLIYEKHDLDSWFTHGIDYADLLQKMGKNAQAMAVYRKLAMVEHKLPRAKGAWIYLNDAARVETMLRNYTEAERLLLSGVEAEHKKSKPDSLHLYYFYQNLTNLYVEQGTFKKAYEGEIKFNEIKLWLQQKRQIGDSKLQMTQLKASLDLEKKENQIAFLAEQKRKQQILLIGAVVVAGLLVGFLVILQRNKKRIERQKTELTVLNHTKDKLFAILSHDLRSPVAGLKNYLMLIQWGALSQAEFADSAQTLAVQLNNVHTMLDNVLNWSVSQMRGIHPNMEKVNILPIIEDEIEVMLPIGEAKNIQIINKINAEVRLLTDKNHLAVIVRNLLQNALKFSSPGSKITFTYFEKDKHSHIVVQDTGVGMTPEQLTQLFNPSKTTSKIGTAREKGTGLGLVLVKELVEANQGTIQVTGELSKGTAVTLRFKAAA
ncbi:tetratricopeptide repeat-containing sensor histidine kinase [Runella sp.]|uniref:sensor histidine kinase n=1 Tax=Runella sp. TaxID=1960881 RepID=UPI003D0E9567